MSSKYSIYAAPRDPQGIYRFCDGKAIYRKDFSSIKEMEAFWDTKISPRSKVDSGPDYEHSMVIVEDGGTWGHYRSPRYSDKALLDQAHKVL